MLYVVCSDILICHAVSFMESCNLWSDVSCSQTSWPCPTCKCELITDHQSWENMFIMFLTRKFSRTWIWTYDDLWIWSTSWTFTIRHPNTPLQSNTFSGGVWMSEFYISETWTHGTLGCFPTLRAFQGVISPVRYPMFSPLNFDGSYMFICLRTTWY